MKLRLTEERAFRKMLEPMHKVGCIRPKHMLKEQALREYCPGKTFMLHFFPNAL